MAETKVLGLSDFIMTALKSLGRTVSLSELRNSVNSLPEVGLPYSSGAFSYQLKQLRKKGYIQVERVGRSLSISLRTRNRKASQPQPTKVVQTQGRDEELRRAIEVLSSRLAGVEGQLDFVSNLRTRLPMLERNINKVGDIYADIIRTSQARVRSGDTAVISPGRA